MLKGKDGAGPKLKDFKAYVDSNEVPEIQALKHDVEQFAKEFPTIGFEKARRRTPCCRSCCKYARGGGCGNYKCSVYAGVLGVPLDWF